jgi:hypothetical protein
MATTTNYGWTTPDDTALVKDGAAAIRTLGSSVDTTTKNLNPSTTLGDIEYRSSTANVNTRLPLGTAGQVLKVNSGATAPEWSSDSVGMTNPMTTTGDTIYSSSGSTPARLGIGSTGNVLTVSGGVPTWAAPSAGGMTLISTTTLSGATTTLSSIPQTYNSLFLVIAGMTANTSDAQFRAMLNNSTNAHSFSRIAAATTAAFTNDRITLSSTTNTSRSNADNVWSLTIDNYTSSTRFKPITWHGRYVTAAVANETIFAAGGFTDVTAISSIVFDYGGTNTFAGGTVLLYGVK